MERFIVELRAAQFAPAPAIDMAKGVFETLLVVRGRPIRLDSHLSRLALSLAAVFEDGGLPRGLRQAVLETSRELRLGRLRLDVAAEAGGGNGFAVKASEVDASIVFPQARTRMRSVNVGNGLGPHKWADRAWIEDVESEDQGGLPLFVLGETDEVLEASRANIFLANSGVLRTPPDDGRILAGIARCETIEIARSLGIRVDERSLGIADLLSADEVFVTGSVRGIEPIGQIDDMPLRLEGRLTGALAAELRSRWLGRYN